MLNADPVGRYRVEDASLTDGVVAGTAGKEAGTTTGVAAGAVAGTTTGVVAGVVARTRGMGARAVGRYRVGDAHLTDLEGEAGARSAKNKKGSHRSGPSFALKLVVDRAKHH
jgi:hypothetical protein